MKLKITEQTKWQDVHLLLTAENLEVIRKKVADVFSFDFYSMTIGDFAELQRGILPRFLREKVEDKNLTVFDYCKINNGIEKFYKDFAALLKNFEVPQSHKERTAAAALPEMNIIEAILCFANRFFSHPDFGTTENLTLYDYILARKSDFMQRKFEYLMLKK